MNRALLTSIAGICAAQALKIPFRVRQAETWEWKDLFRTGGMPSSHASGAAALASYIACKKGLSSVTFALSAFLGIIVMYDAMGIRHHAGLIATEVNELEETVIRLTEEHPSHVHPKMDKALEERLGHFPDEVLGGALLGTIVGCLSFAAEPRPLPKRPEDWPQAIRKWLPGWS